MEIKKNSFFLIPFKRTSRNSRETLTLSKEFRFDKKEFFEKEVKGQISLNTLRTGFSLKHSVRSGRLKHLFIMINNLLFAIILVAAIANTLTNNQCGKVDQKFGGGLVVNGKNFKRGAYPWMVALFDISDEEKDFYFCVGTYVLERKVLTGEDIFFPQEIIILKRNINSRSLPKKQR